jgi:hypothetical protein
MIDINKAIMTVEKLEALQASNPDLFYIQSITIPEKQKWKIQIIGCYDLIYPFMYVNYPTRQDVYEYVKESINFHHSQNVHCKGSGQTSIAPCIMRTPEQTAGQVNYLSDPVIVRANSLVNEVGYGI